MGRAADVSLKSRRPLIIRGPALSAEQVDKHNLKSIQIAAVQHFC
jgi:3-polyprenyl-4-hydroxybenzoate decarboxylase